MPVSPEGDLDAGEFSTWATATQAAIRGERIADVPCGGCTACCTSSQFVHIGPDETTTLAHIPSELLFPAPGLPRGHVVLGYDERGHCPMLVDNACSIYEHRPRTCRTYDCRVFPASGITPGDEAKRRLSQQAQRWRFKFPTDADSTRLEAVRAAAAFLREHSEALVESTAPLSPTQQAVLAVEFHDLFLSRDVGTGRVVVVNPDPDVVLDTIARRERHRVGPR